VRGPLAIEDVVLTGLCNHIVAFLPIGGSLRLERLFEGCNGSSCAENTCEIALAPLPDASPARENLASIGISDRVKNLNDVKLVVVVLNVFARRVQCLVMYFQAFLGLLVWFNMASQTSSPELYT
jgi:hypothetical protein